MIVGSSKGKVPFGLKDGRLWYVTEVPTGLACDCVCPDPACNKPLIARNNSFPGRKRIFHFRHASLTSGCGGRESALHRMAKEIVEKATSLLLPSWSAGDLGFDAAQTSLLPGSAQEVTLDQAQMRPDVRVAAAIGVSYLPALYVEIKVSHAVDYEKRKRVIDGNLSMIEIDLSGLDDDMLQDEAAFRRGVLDDASNRRWIHIGKPAFLADMTGQDILHVVNPHDREKNVRLKSGSVMFLRAQDVVSYSPGSETPRVVEVELADTVKSDGQRVDGLGNNLPYKPGLYCRSWRRGSFPRRGDEFKTHLMPIVQDEPENAQGELLEG
jgi:hypothetical protein